MDYCKIKARETITDQYDRVRIIKNNEYKLKMKTVDMYYVIDELDKMTGFRKEEFYDTDED